MGRGFAGRARAAGRCGAGSITAAQAAALDSLELLGVLSEEDSEVELESAESDLELESAESDLELVSGPLSLFFESLRLLE